MNPAASSPCLYSTCLRRVRSIYNDTKKKMQSHCEDEMAYLPLGRQYLNLIKDFDQPHKVAASMVKAQKSALNPKEPKAKAKGTRKRKA